jgi:hypothetical protein
VARTRNSTDESRELFLKQLLVFLALALLMLSSIPVHLTAAIGGLLGR